MKGLIVDLEVPYFGAFRRPASTSLVLSYPLPPFSTVFGLLINALGVRREEYEEEVRKLMANLALNLRPLHCPKERPVREAAKLLKLIERGERPSRPSSFPSSPVYRYFLIHPNYRIYIGGEETEEIAQALRSPRRPLYLGQSDDMVVVDVTWEGEVREEKKEETFGLLQGKYEGCELLRIPFAVEGGKIYYLSPLSLPSCFPFPIPQKRLSIFNGEGVELLGLKDVAGKEERK
ncbi:MAG: CRISPR-associated protein Cas5 [Dehalococcoidia bacterium]|nr:CRISPR-associated protein Cas5 [Dehalococcoidia bacterium]